MYICFANRLHITNSEERFKSPICLCYAFRIFTLRNGLNLDDRSLCVATNPTHSNRQIHSTKYSLLFTANCVNLCKTILWVFFSSTIRKSWANWPTFDVDDAYTETIAVSTRSIKKIRRKIPLSDRIVNCEVCEANQKKTEANEKIPTRFNVLNEQWLEWIIGRGRRRRRRHTRRVAVGNACEHSRCRHGDKYGFLHSVHCFSDSFAFSLMCKARWYAHSYS